MMIKLLKIIEILLGRKAHSFQTIKGINHPINKSVNGRNSSLQCRNKQESFNETTQNSSCTMIHKLQKF